MTTNIDALSGRKLDMAVEKALGRAVCTCGGRVVSAGKYGTQARCERCNLPPAAFRSTNIAAAWELDGAGWRWESEEHYKGVTSPVVWVRCFTENALYIGEAHFSDFPTKAAAYARARCQAWLQARQSETKR